MFCMAAWYRLIDPLFFDHHTKNQNILSQQHPGHFHDHNVRLHILRLDMCKSKEKTPETIDFSHLP